MREVIGKIIDNREIAKDTMKMVLEIQYGLSIGPGQFVNIAIPEKFLRRPISVSDVEEKSDALELTIIYKVIGEGTGIMSGMQIGTELNLLTELGNGYDIEAAGEKPLLVGGGAGVPPMYYLAKELRKKGCDVTVILGFNTVDEIFYQEEFESLGCKVTVTTVDGSHGVKGFVTDAINKDLGHTYFYACGPEAMLKALDWSLDIPGEMSLETRMGCGFGACMGCSCKTKVGEKRLCKEGPVLKREEILWED